MNKIFGRILCMLFVVFTLPLSSYATQKFTLDDKHTYVLWKIQHLGFSTQAGKWYAMGSVILDEANLKNSQVEATIQVGNIVTGIPELDTHLKGPLFFDVARYPTATFVSNKVEPTGKMTGKVYGALTLHGITKPVVLDVTFNKIGKNPVTEKLSVGFSASTKIKRSDFGINTLLPSLGDDVDIQIGAEGYLANP